METRKRKRHDPQLENTVSLQKLHYIFLNYNKKREAINQLNTSDSLYNALMKKIGIKREELQSINPDEAIKILGKEKYEAMPITKEMIALLRGSLLKNKVEGKSADKVFNHYVKYKRDILFLYKSQKSVAAILCDIEQYKLDHGEEIKWSEKLLPQFDVTIYEFNLFLLTFNTSFARLLKIDFTKIELDENILNSPISKKFIDCLPKDIHSNVVAMPENTTENPSSVQIPSSSSIRVHPKEKGLIVHHYCSLRALHLANLYYSRKKDVAECLLMKKEQYVYLEKNLKLSGFEYLKNIHPNYAITVLGKEKYEEAPILASTVSDLLEAFHKDSEKLLADQEKLSQQMATLSAFTTLDAIKKYKEKNKLVINWSERLEIENLTITVFDLNLFLLEFHSSFKKLLGIDFKEIEKIEKIKNYREKKKNPKLSRLLKIDAVCSLINKKIEKPNIENPIVEKTDEKFQEVHFNIIHYALYMKNSVLPAAELFSKRPRHQFSSYFRTTNFSANILEQIPIETGKKLKGAYFQPITDESYDLLIQKHKNKLKRYFKQLQSDPLPCEMIEEYEELEEHEKNEEVVMDEGIGENELFHNNDFQPALINHQANEFNLMQLTLAILNVENTDNITDVDILGELIADEINKLDCQINLTRQNNMKLEKEGALLEKSLNYNGARFQDIKKKFTLFQEHRQRLEDDAMNYLLKKTSSPPSVNLISFSRFKKQILDGENSSNDDAMEINTDPVQSHWKEKIIHLLNLKNTIDDDPTLFWQAVQDNIFPLKADIHSLNKEYETLCKKKQELKQSLHKSNESKKIAKSLKKQEVESYQNAVDYCNQLKPNG